MPFKSRWTTPIPTICLPSYIFTSPSTQLSDKPVLIDAATPEYYLSLHSYREWCKRFAAGLLEHGFKPGDRLLLYSGNTLFFPVVFIGTVMAGGIFTGANPAYVARELAYQLKDSGATILITSEDSATTALDAAREIGFPREKIYCMGSGHEVFDNTVQPHSSNLKHWSSILASESAGADFCWEECNTPEDMRRYTVLNYSSGTTGLPKGVTISHLNYISNCAQTAHLASLNPNQAADQVRAVGLGFLPMYHAYGQTRHCVSNPRAGTPTYIMRKFDFIKMLEYVQRYRVTALNLVPPIALALTKRPEVKNYDLTSVEAAFVGAAPLDAATVSDFNLIFNGQVTMKQGWGMTEVTCSACGWDPAREPDAGRVGELNANMEAMIVDEEGREVATGERGELLVRGGNVMMGYWGKPEATRDTITSDGWLKTGDIAIHHDDGTLSIVDRKKELIKVRGNQVAPAELEGVLVEHPEISDAAVIGVTRDGEEYPRAYIVMSNGASTRPDTIAAWLAKRVAPHKRLTGGVVVVNEVPRNPSGKILRKVLRERAKDEVGGGARAKL